MKAVFDAKPGSGYDDGDGDRYHFPRRYLDVAWAAVGDWIVYREPKRNRGRAGYVAVARVTRLEDDPHDPRFVYARLTDYLPFDRVLPLAEEGTYFEGVLRDTDPDKRGVALHGKAIREISEAEFGAIVRAGLSQTLDPANARRLMLEPDAVDAETRELLGAPPPEQRRNVSEILVNRTVREASFRHRVCRAYGDTCAVTGLYIVNGGGKAEVQAAHIKPVAAGGPDVVQNGIALSGTVHWLFDRHLISVDENYQLLVAHNRVPLELQRLFERQRSRIRLPEAEQDRPRPEFLRHHVEAFAGV